MDKTSFRALVENYRSMVYRIALNFFRNIQDAEDITQEVMLKLYLRKEPFDGPNHARNWLIQVTLNDCRSIWRSHCCVKADISGTGIHFLHCLIPLQINTPTDHSQKAAGRTLPPFCRYYMQV